MDGKINIDWGRYNSLDNEGRAKFVRGIIASAGLTGVGVRWADPESEGMALVRIEEYDYARREHYENSCWLDGGGRLVGRGRCFDGAGGFHEGMAWVKKGYGHYWVDRDMRPFGELEGFSDTGDFHEGFALCVRKRPNDQAPLPVLYSRAGEVYANVSDLRTEHVFYNVFAREGGGSGPAVVVNWQMRTEPASPAHYTVMEGVEYVSEADRDGMCVVKYSDGAIKDEKVDEMIRKTIG